MKFLAESAEMHRCPRTLTTSKLRVSWLGWCCRVSGVERERVGLSARFVTAAAATTATADADRMLSTTLAPCSAK